MHRAVLENMQKRRSVRQFNGRDLSEAEIRTVLQAASRPPATALPIRRIRGRLSERDARASRICRSSSQARRISFSRIVR